MATVTSPPVHSDQRIVLHNVGWETYERLLADHADRRAPRFTYDRGELEIVSPGSTHERDTNALSLLVEIVAAALSIAVDNVGMMTYKREEWRRGFEPDASFYIQNEPLVRDKPEIDPTVDPPPDLVIEVDVTSPSLDKFPLFAQMGVPEVWRCVQGRVTFHRLHAGVYQESDTSGVLPLLTSDVITRFLAERRTLRRPEWFQMIDDWARTQADDDRSSR